MERKRPVDQDEQQNLFSSMCITSSPINHDPVLTSSCAYVRRINLWSKHIILLGITTIFNTISKQIEKPQEKKDTILYLFIEIN